MIYKMKTNKSVTEVKSNMENAAKTQGFGVLKEYEFKEILQTKGFDIDREITVFELCNPPAAAAALTTHPEISSFLPCRVSIYEEDGATVVSTIDMEKILESFELENEFEEKMGKIYNQLKNAILMLI